MKDLKFISNFIFIFSILLLPFAYSQTENTFSQPESESQWIDPVNPLNIPRSQYHADEALIPIIVTNTNDTGFGSLRDAIDQVNSSAGPDSIIFNIPTSDPGFNAANGIWTLKPQSPLPPITDQELVIDGFSQGRFIETDTNIDGPEIELTWDYSGTASAFVVTADSCVIMGLVINGWGHAGIRVEGAIGGAVIGCYLGTDAKGTGANPNNYGIYLCKKSIFFHIGPTEKYPYRNVITGNSLIGVAILDSCSNISVIDNFIGLNKDGDNAVAEGGEGVLTLHSDNNLIRGNHIGGLVRGIRIDHSVNNLIEDNFIGAEENWLLIFRNSGYGIFITYDSQHSTIRHNIIGNNDEIGICILGQNTMYNTISRNSISNNGIYGIRNASGGNNQIPPPVIESIINNEVKGHAGTGIKIELFSDENNQGRVFLDSTFTDETGKFSVLLSVSPPFQNITATATDTSGNTSEFSTPVVTSVETTTSEQLPEKYALHQNYPNPFNESTIIDFELPRDSFVYIKIFNIKGEDITTLIKENRNAGLHHVKFNTADLSSGVYFIKFVTNEFMEMKKCIIIK